MHTRKSSKMTAAGPTAGIATALSGSPLRGGRKKPVRKGVAAMETALIAPLLILVVYGSLDLAQYINSAQVIANASREAARVAARDSTSARSEVESAVHGYLGSIYPGMDTTTIEDATTVVIYQSDGSELTSGDIESIPSGSSMSVLVEFEFSAIRWMPGLDFWKGDYNRTETFCRRE